MCVKNVCLGMSLLMCMLVCVSACTVYDSIPFTFCSISMPFVRNDSDHCMVRTFYIHSIEHLLDLSEISSVDENFQGQNVPSF